MRKRLIIAVALVSAIPAAAAEVHPLFGQPFRSQLKGPVPTAPLKDWLAAGDSVAGTPGSDATGTVHFALTVSTDGGVARCTVERSSGSAGLDDRACRILERSGRFSPATDGAGRPVIGVYRGVASWTAPGNAAPVIPLVEMAVGVESMPQPMADPAYVDLAVAVDAAGNVDGCAIGEGLNLSGQPIPARIEAGKILGQTACLQAVKVLKLAPVKTAAGEAVRSVQAARVLFTAQPAALAAGSTPDPGHDIVVVGRAIISRPEAKIPYKGFDPIKDFEPVSYETVLLEAQSGQWYRATLQPPCIGSSIMMLGTAGPDGRISTSDPGMAFMTRADGTFDRNSVIIVKTGVRGEPNHRCYMRSLIESDPPHKRKRSAAKAP